MGDLELWIVRPSRPTHAHISLFCFPHAGVGPSAYRGWEEQLRPSGIDVCLVHPPGRESRFREEPVRSMGDVAQSAAAAIIATEIGPYAFYGHSLGAKVAFETARAIRRQGGAEPVHLFVSASSAPQLPWHYPPIHELPRDAFLQELQVRYGGIPEAVLQERELLDLLLPALRADLTVLETYTYAAEPPLAAGITAFGGIADQTVPEAYMAAWRHQTQSDFQVQMMPGGHFFGNTARSSLMQAIVRTTEKINAERLANAN